MEKVTLTIDGRVVHCPPATSIFNAAKELNIKIPTLCHHPNLKPAGACRLCLVEDEKSGRLMASCVTPVSPDMAIRTDSPTIIKHRTNIVRLMIANHPESCVVCNQGNRCELRLVAAQLGVGHTGLYPMPHSAGFEQANPFIIRDLSKCILCGKCIRADQELVVVGAIDYNHRGFRSRPATAHEAPLEASSCTFCGTCLAVCPTAALTAKNLEYVGSPQKEAATVCGFCGVGCALKIGSFEDRLVEVNPSERADAVNQATLCVRGHFAHDFLNAPERLKTPMIRKDGELCPVSWDDALSTVAARIRAIKKEYGPQSVAFLGSSKCTIEENYLFQKMARAILGTHNVDHISYGWGRAVVGAIDTKLDGGGRIARLDALENAGLIFVMGADPTHSVPVAGYAIKRAARFNGVPLIVVDPRKTGLVPFASQWLPLLPCSDYELISALAALLYQRQAYDSDFIARFTVGFDQYREDIGGLDLEKACHISGLGMEVLERAADLIAGKKVTFVLGRGVLQQQRGGLVMGGLLNLALMTASLQADGGSFYYATTENNQIGAWDMGSSPDHLPGRHLIRNDTHRRTWEQHWGTRLSPDPGLNVVRMIEAAERGHLKALYVMGENPLCSLPQFSRVRQALDRVEFTVVQDILYTETAGEADVVLPGAAFSEKGGAFTNLEGRIQPFEPVLSPPGEALPDWEILSRLFGKLGYSRRYESLQDIREEIGQLVPMYGDLGRLKGTAWVKSESNRRIFHPSAGGEPIPFSPIIPFELRSADQDYPFEAILGSLRVHLGSGTRTGRSNRIKDFALTGAIELSREDGMRLNLKDGDRVTLHSPHGSVSREITFKKDLRAGLIFVPIGFHGNDAIQLLDLAPAGEAVSPGWNVCPVRIEKSEP